MLTLSLPQTDVYYDQLLFPDSAIYNIGARVEVNGDLDPLILHEAVNLLARQHESLRSVLHIIDDHPFLKVLTDALPTFHYVDLSAQPNQREACLQFIQAEFRKPFNLRDGSLLNSYYLVRESNHKCYIVGKYHHLIVDGWSTSLLFARLAANYTRIRNKTSEIYHEWSYAEFVADDQAYCNTADFNIDRQYWQQKIDTLGSFNFLSAIAATKPGELTQSVRRELYLSRQQYNEIIAFCTRYAVTPFHFLLGVITVYLSHFSDDDHLIFGLPVLNRKNKRFKETVGMFAGVSPLFVKLDRKQDFLQLIKTIRQELRENYRHQRLPLSIVASAMNRQGGPLRQPFYQVFFSYEKHDYSTPFDGHPSTVIPLTHQLERAPLAVYVREFDDQRDVKIDFDINPSLLPLSWLQAFTNRFQSLITDILLHPDKPAGSFPLLHEPDAKPFLFDFNNTKTAYELDNNTVLDLIGEQAKKTPHAPALEFNNTSITYQRLEEESDLLAHRLMSEYGVGSTDMVALMVNRSQQLPVALLGILKTGACYVPVAPTQPAPRIDYILAQSKVKLVLTTADFQQDLINRNYTTVLLSEENHQAAAKVTVKRNWHPRDLIYIMYTSGSTGRPKGVEIEHRAVCNFLLSMKDRLGIHAGHRLLAVTTYSFDISVLELFLPLICGATVVIAPDETVQQPLLLKNTLQECRPSFFQCTPGMWQMLLEAGWQGDHTITALCGGEHMGPELAAQLLPRVKTLWNMYGPTETTIWSAMQQVRHTGDGSKIGHPIANTDIYILSPSLQLMPGGMPGDIYIGGLGLARGYKDQPEITSGRFIAHPFKAGEKLYRTGDRGKWCTDGSIEFIGRNDDQVKIRGYRVEPAEIEQVLLQYPLIKQAVVVPRKGAGQRDRLVAFVVTAQQVNVAALQDHIKASLPAYMVPHYFIEIDQLPRNANGKIDRHRLPAIDPDKALPGSAAYKAPASETEIAIANIWEQELDRSPIGIHDNFFELGGHSLAATRIISKINRITGSSLSLHQLFHTATVAGLASIIKQNAPAAVPLSIEPVHDQPTYTVSPAQRRLWLVCQLPTASRAYHITGLYAISGLSNVDAFKHCWQILIDRHESLRTVFPEYEGMPRQKILPAGQTELPIHEIDISECNHDQATTLFVEQDQCTPFNLSKGPLIRAALLKTAELEYRFLLTVHHLVTDGWSMQVLVRELLALYKNAIHDNQFTLPSLPFQYRDFAHWQITQNASGTLGLQRDYWRHQLAGPLPVITWPTVSSRPEIQSFTGDAVAGELDKLCTIKLRQRGQQTGATPFMTLLSVFGILLYRYTGQEQLIIGTAADGRYHEALHNQVGLYMNLLPLRFSITASGTFNELLKQVRQVTLDAYAHQAYPFDQLLEGLSLKRDISRSPIFDVMVAYEGDHFENDLALDGSGLQLQPLSLPAAISKYDLTITFKAYGAATGIYLEYNTALFDRAYMNRMLEHFRVLAESAANSPDVPVATLQMLEDAEKNTILSMFNQTMRVRNTGTIYELLAAQLAKTPQRIALEYNGLKYTYRELHERAADLAFQLRRQYNVGSNVLVGIMLNRTPELLIGMLAILKAGGAYVPVDPHLPATRIQYILQDSQPVIMLTQSSYCSLLEQYNQPYIIVPAGPLLPMNTAAREFPVRHGAEDLAYVMYTSGTTGKPKGVEIKQNAVVNVLLSMQQKPGMGEEDRILAVTTCSFDISVLELLLPLTTGAGVILATYEESRNAVLLKRKIEATSPSIMQCTPGMWQLLLDAGFSAKDKLKAWCGGERMSRSLAGRLLGNTLELWNLYGPTETTIWSATRRIEHEDEACSIGQPIDNTEIYILDHNLQPQPIGLPGDIYIGGQGLARGYRNEPALTSEKFIENPFNTGTGLYKTGDTGKWLPNGHIEYLGRNDDQVKIRGNRVEPAEIEHTLSKYPGIQAAVVTTARDAHELHYLVAYYVATIAINVADLRNFLKNELPDYMIPGYWVALDRLPLSPNGKVNRKALPEPASFSGAGTKPEYTPGRNRLELELIRLWEEEFDKIPIGIHDDFFELGGHSLNAMRILSRMYKEMDLELELYDLFAHPTIGALAALTASGFDNKFYQPIFPVPEQEYYELSAGQRRLWINSQTTAGSLACNVFEAFSIEGLLQIERLEQALHCVVEKHESLRTIFITINGAPVQQVLPLKAIRPAFRFIDLRDQNDATEQISNRAHIELELPFDLSNGPLVRVTLLRTADERHVLLLTLHHIITDARSIEVIMQEWVGAYRSLQEGTVAQSTRPAIQYKDYAKWQNDCLKSKAADDDRQYWVNEFRDGVPSLNMSTDYPRPAEPGHRGARISKTIDAAVFSKLTQLVRQQKTTLYAALMTLSNILLYRYTGQKHLVTGYPVSMRDLPELKDQAGLYLNTLPLYTRLDPADTFLTVLYKVREGLLQGHKHRQYPFDRIIAAIGVERNRSRPPLFDVAVVLQNLAIHQQQTTLTGDLRVQSLPTDQVVAALDLRLEFVQRDTYLQLHFDYNTDLFFRDTITLFMNRFMTLLGQALEDPDCRIDSFSFGAGQAQHQNQPGNLFTLEF